MNSEQHLSKVDKIKAFINEGNSKYGIVFPIGLSIATVILFTILLLPWK